MECSNGWLVAWLFDDGEKCGVGQFLVCQGFLVGRRVIVFQSRKKMSKIVYAR